MGSVGKVLKTVFTLGVFGTIATAAGTLLLPFFGNAAGMAVAQAGATNLSVLTSFWSPLWTGVDGTVGLSAGLGKVFNGLGALGQSGGAVLSAAFNAFSAGTSPLDAMGAALAAPAASLG